MKDLFQKLKIIPYVEKRYNSKFIILISFSLLNGCFLTAKFNHPMDGIAGIILDAVLVNAANSKSALATTITVKIGDVEYKNGDTFTFAVTKTNFENPQTITIQNNTSVNLDLTGATKVVVYGTDSANFIVNQPSLTTLIPNATTDFTLYFNTSFLFLFEWIEIFV